VQKSRPSVRTLTEVNVPTIGPEDVPISVLWLGSGHPTRNLPNGDEWRRNPTRPGTLCPPGEVVTTGRTSFATWDQSGWPLSLAITAGIATVQHGPSTYAAAMFRPMSQIDGRSQGFL